MEERRARAMVRRERKDDDVRLAANERSVFTTRAGEERVEG
jgi:hypothetical protein